MIRGAAEDVAAIAIGRNEGERLVRCLSSLAGRVGRIVYIDSGSTDDSLAQAQALGAEVVELDTSQPFTAARARNAGLAHVADDPQIRYVQFVDGDCEVQPDWIDTARRFLEDNAKVAVVCGRRRERFPEATLWNRLTDEEWAADPGKVRACGGDAMMRRAALMDVGGFNPNLIAGEEPELCVRLRQAGWEVWRLPAEMTLHDAAMTRFSQWWSRCRRAGYTYAEGVAMYGAPPERHNVARLRRTILWGGVLPLIVVLGMFVTPFALLLLLIWPLQVLRLQRRGMRSSSAAFLMLGKLAEMQGALTWVWRRLRAKPAQLIEYK
ncbi:glycosyltransferase family 2 protein [Tropicimonas sp. S265A]|uniref:glycosyltransferase family 2 protein n=1 Tax=Tropicimonas sp. S265A TaxID=3415134 RepID=UPI003C7D7585